jgi:flagellar hook protein FlgE
MLRGLTTAASGMLADERYQQLLSNNLANAQTPGFKSSDAELLGFPEQLLRLVNYGQNTGSQIGKLGTGVVFQEGVPLFSQGQLQSTNRNLDVAVVDSTPAGSYAAVATNPTQAGTVQSINGTIQAGPGGRLQVNGQSLAVVDGNGQSVPGVFAAKNPAYQGTALTASDGRPDYDPNGNPSYIYVNGAGNVVGQATDAAWQHVGLRVGTQDNMGLHSFFAVDYQSPEVPSGLALTRDGHLDVDAQNVLIDASGHAVLPIGANGLPVQNGRIVINTAYTGTDLFQSDGSPVTDTQGNPSYRVLDTNGNPITGRLGTVDADVAQLNPLGQTEFQVGGTLNPAQAATQLRPTGGSLQPGQMEQSNVDVTSTMTQMMAVIGHYQANQEVIRTEDSMLQKAVDDVGKVT